jgi:hypothetical protein
MAAMPKRFGRWPRSSVRLSETLRGGGEGGMAIVGVQIAAAASD